MLFSKIDTVGNKIKDSGSNIICKHWHTFLSVNCISNFIVVAISEETKRHYWRQDTLLKYKIFKVSIEVINARVLGLHPRNAVELPGGLTTCPQTPKLHILLTSLTKLDDKSRVGSALHSPNFNSCISPWHWFMWRKCFCVVLISHASKVLPVPHNKKWSFRSRSFFSINVRIWSHFLKKS